jgi:hypothetical protein
MNGPGLYEDKAAEILRGNREEVAEAQVYALLALASAVNRIADAHEAVARALADLADNR